MPIFKFGHLIKKKREELGYTQEDLADGICSVTTLSRIENGERMPTKEHFEMLIQRLGYSDTTLDSFVDEKTYYLHELKFQIRQAIFLNDGKLAQRLFLQFNSLVSNPTAIESQFILLCSVLIYPESYSNLERLQKLEAAIKLTCPKYGGPKFPRVLSFEEIIILNNISACLYEEGKTDDAIDILYRLKQYYESSTINTEEVLRTQPMILYNLSKFLGCSGRYNECIEICDFAIRIARETGRCPLLARMLYNRAWSLVKRNAPGDLESARESTRLAFYMASAMAQSSSVEHYRHFWTSTFPDEQLL